MIRSRKRDVHLSMIHFCLSTECEWSQKDGQINVFHYIVSSFFKSIRVPLLPDEASGTCSGFPVFPFFFFFNSAWSISKEPATSTSLCLFFPFFNMLKSSFVPENPGASNNPTTTKELLLCHALWPRRKYCETLEVDQQAQ